MNWLSILTLVLGIAGVLGAAAAIFMNNLGRGTIDLLQARSAVLESDLKDARAQVDGLQGQVDTLSKLPLGQIAESMEKIMETQNTILATQNRILESLTAPSTRKK